MTQPQQSTQSIQGPESTQDATALDAAQLSAEIASLRAQLAGMQATLTGVRPAAVAPSGPAFDTDDQGAYIVRPGDTLQSIAEDLHVDAAALFRVNQQAGRMIDADTITSGMRLVLPPAEAESEAATVLGGAL